MAKPGQQNVAQELIKIIINYVAELRINSSEYNIHKPNNAQWRYGFLAVLKDGSRVYGEPSKEDIGSASLQVPENTEHLWLVVAATPKEIYDTGADNQWPYQFTLDNTEPDGDKCRVIKK